MCLCHQVNLLLTPSGRELLLEADLCGPPPKQDLDPQLGSW